MMPALLTTVPDGGLITVDGTKTSYTLETVVAESQKWRFRAYAKNSAGTSSVASNIARVNTGDTPDTGKPTDVRIVFTAVFSAGTPTVDIPTTLEDESITATYIYGNMIDVYWNWPQVDGEADSDIGAFRWQWRVKASDMGWQKWDDDATASGAMSAVTAWQVPTTVQTEFQRQHEVPRPADFDGKNDKLQFRVQAAKAVDNNGTATGAGGWVESNVINHQGDDHGACNARKR